MVASTPRSRQVNQETSFVSKAIIVILCEKLVLVHDYVPTNVCHPSGVHVLALMGDLDPEITSSTGPSPQ